MKKLAFLTVLALFVTSCHNDDIPVAPENPTSVTGTNLLQEY